MPKKGTLITGNGKVDASSERSCEGGDHVKADKAEVSASQSNGVPVSEPEIYLIRPKRTSLAARMHLAEAQGRAMERMRSQATKEGLLGADTSASEQEKSDMQAVLFVDFVRQMLTLDPEQRPSASKLLKHPFLTDVDETDVYWDAHAHARQEEELLRKQAEAPGDGWGGQGEGVDDGEAERCDSDGACSGSESAERGRADEEAECSVED